MRIGFDVSQTAEQMTGCGIVADQFLRHLVPAGPSDVFIPYPVFGNYRNPEFARATRPHAPNVESDQFGLSWVELNQAWDAPDGDMRAFLGDPDVVHANNFFCPTNLPVRIVYTLYDMSQTEHPEYHTERNRLACFNGLFDASLHADHLVVYFRAFAEQVPEMVPSCGACACIGRLSRRQAFDCGSAGGV